MEGQVQEYEEDTETVSNAVLGACVLCGHRSKAGSSDDDSNESSDEHASAGVDLVVEPGTKRVVDEA